MFSETTLKLTASVVIGTGVSVFAWWLFRVMHSEDLRQGDQWRYDISRINQLRRLDVIYRVFYPVIQVLGRFNRAVFRENLPEIQRQIQAAGLPRFYLAEEYLARAELMTLCVAPLYIYVFVRWLGPVGLLAAVAAMLATVWILRHRLATLAGRRLLAIKRRMPFLLDLLTLLMEAGSTFLGALRQAVAEFEGHPIAEEFGRMLADMNLGKTRTESLTAMRDRLADDEITGIIGSIVQGEALGSPLAHVFRTQAEVLRLKRSQRAELLAGEAGVNMLLPGVLIMFATVLIIIGPFLLNYLYFGLSM
jgi:tight adherence protein C